jgi:hypothetical protein
MANPPIKDLAYRGLASALGGPVDLTTMFLRPFGYAAPDKQIIGGSEWIGQKMQDVGLIGSARSPLQEFLASMAAPTPSGLAKGVALGGAALIKPVKAAEVASNSTGMASKISSLTNPVKEGFIRLFHAGSDPVKGGFFKEVPSGGVFDGFFALPDRYGAYGTGAKYYADIPAGKALTNYDLNYNIPYDSVAKALEGVSGIKRTNKRFDALWSAVVEDKSQDVINSARHEDVMDMFKLSLSDDIGAASWEAQRLRGKLAKKLGYDAVEMADENGTSYLITSGTKLNRDTDDVVEQIAKEPTSSALQPSKERAPPPGFRYNRKGQLIKID